MQSYYKLLWVGGAVTATLCWKPLAVQADEGMWLYNAPPRKLLQERHGFEPSSAWLEHIQKSSIRFNSGGSGSFVSEDGLIISNHHVGSDDLQKISDEKHDYVRDGFHARTRAEEKRCLDLELNVLMSMKTSPAGSTPRSSPGSLRKKRSPPGGP